MAAKDQQLPEFRKPISIDYQPHRVRTAGKPVLAPYSQDRSVSSTDEGGLEDASVVETVTSETVSIIAS
jgi:hypothetical protein